MTTLFHDVSNDANERTDKPNGAGFTEVLYADDTILLGKDVTQIQQTLHKIEEHSKKYGLALNKDKCIHLRFNSLRRLAYKDKTKMPIEEEATYLGAQLHEKGSVDKDINQKIGAATAIWRKLDPLWKGTNNSTKTKLNVYNAVVRSKVAYSLETAGLHKGHRAKLDAFQQKGLRMILGLEPTFLNREMTNQKVLDIANCVLFEHNNLAEYISRKDQEGTEHVPKLMKLSDYIKKRAIAHLGHTIRASDEDP
eukprot:8602596-Karenia_brevis.AAC.1